MSIFLQNIHQPLHNSWNGFLDQPNIKELQKIEKNIGKKPYTPTTERVLHFLTVPLSKVKVIILGQDPYPQENVATGRAFEVGTLQTWDAPFRQVSLKNIIRLIYKTYYNKVDSFKNIREWNRENGAITEPNQLFKAWEKQGVLLLNTALTCETGKSASHSKLWRNFTGELLHYINQKSPDTCWILWGGHAQKITESINIKNKLTSNHPMMCSPKNDNDFLYGKTNTLAETKHLVDWRG